MTDPRHELKLREWMAARGMRWERSVSRDPERGETVRHRLSPAGEPRGVVMLVHGAGNDALFSFTSLVMGLLAEGLEVFAFDLDGHGRNSTTRLDPATLHEAVPRAAEATGAAERGLPLHLLAVSFGGVLALDALARHPERFASAVLIATPLEIDASRAAILAEFRLPLLRALWKGRRHAGLWGAVPSFGPFKRGVYPLRLAVSPAEGAFGYVKVLNSVIERIDPRTAARSIDVPVLLVYGDRDRIVPVTQGEELARLIPDAVLLRLPGQSHLSVLSAAAAPVVDWLAARRVGAVE